LPDFGRQLAEQLAAGGEKAWQLQLKNNLLTPLAYLNPL
jgi:hypothetical protein